MSGFVILVVERPEHAAFLAYMVRVRAELILGDTI